MIIVFIYTERKVCVERDAEAKICRISMNFIYVGIYIDCILQLLSDELLHSLEFLFPNRLF